MAVKGTIKITTESFGELEGPREDKKSIIYEFFHKVYLPQESEEHRVQGMRKILPFEIVKSVDRTSPILYQILCQNVLCTEILIELWRIAENSGEEEVYFEYLLSDARIVSVEDWMPPTYISENESIGHLEKVKILARTISWTNKDGNVQFEETSF